jgi:SAM-dependent methyltransferase
MTVGTRPAYRIEAQLRYALVAPVIAEASLWVDLGCGAGSAAAGALRPGHAGDVILVDADDRALQHARRELRDVLVTTLAANLASETGVAAVTEAVGDRQSGVVTCFETLADLETFVPAVELLLGLSHAHTVVLSVPNDAFWSVDQPFRRTAWGEGAFEELRRLVPAAHLRLDQVPLAGSAIAPPGDSELALEPVRLDAERVPSSILLAFGPGQERLRPVAAARTSDAGEERRVERERASQMAFLFERVKDLERAR